MVSNHEVRREYVLDQAVRAGKFNDARRTYWRGEYDRNAAHTEQLIELLASGTVVSPPAAISEEPYPRDLFPELARTERRGRSRGAPGAPLAGATATAPTPAASVEPATASHPRPTVPATEADLDQRLVAAWSRELFPEAASEGASPARVTRANDG